MDSISNKEAVLVEVRSAMDESQYFSIRLQNGFVKLRLMLDSYKEEVVSLDQFLFVSKSTSSGVI